MDWSDLVIFKSRPVYSDLSEVKVNFGNSRYWVTDLRFAPRSQQVAIGIGVALTLVAVSWSSLFYFGLGWGRQDIAFDTSTSGGHTVASASSANGIAVGSRSTD